MKYKKNLLIKVKLLTLGLIVSNITFGQFIHVQLGTTITKITWPKDSVHSKTSNTLGGSCFIGIDYLNKTYFDVSSNIGYFSRGSILNIQTHSNGEITNNYYSIKENILSLNTLVHLKYPIKKNLIPFLSFGPSLNYLLSFSNKSSIPIKNEHILYSDLLIGGGVKYTLSKLELGIQTDFSLNPNNHKSQSSIPKVSNTRFISVSLAYKLNQ